MALELAINTNRMPHTTKLVRLVKAPEDLYYLLLFGTHPSYAGKAEAWRSWIAQGFSVMLKDPLPGAEKAHRIVQTVSATPRRHTLTIEGGDSGTVGKLAKLFQTIERLRGRGNLTPGPSPQAERGGEESAERLIRDQDVTAQLVTPLAAALKAARLRPDEAEALQLPLTRALAILADGYITSIDVRTVEKAPA